MALEKNVLVVDDETMIRESVSAYITKQGYHVFAAEDGKEALDVFQKHPIMFVILDLMLPGMSGEEVCQAIRRQSRVPIIMLTAKTQENDILNGLNIGADDYVTKPFSIKQLYARMEAVLRQTVSDALLFLRTNRQPLHRAVLKSPSDTAFAAYQYAPHYYLTFMQKSQRSFPRPSVMLLSQISFGCSPV